VALCLSVVHENPFLIFTHPPPRRHERTTRFGGGRL